MTRPLMLAMIGTTAWTSLAMAADPVPGPKEAEAPQSEAKTLEAKITPTAPYLLPDGRSKLVVKKESIYLGRAGRTGTVQLLLDDSALTIVPRTVIHAGGYRFEFNTAPAFEFSDFQEEDMIFTIVERCRLRVLSSRQEAPRVAMKELAETIEMEVTHGRVHQVFHTIKGDGQQFLVLKPTSMEISRFHPDPELGARIYLDVINNFGAQSIRLDYKKKKQVTLGNETITLESSGFDFETKTIAIKVSTTPMAAEAEATIVEYGAAP